MESASYWFCWGRGGKYWFCCLTQSLESVVLASAPGSTRTCRETRTSFDVCLLWHSTLFLWRTVLSYSVEGTSQWVGAGSGGSFPKAAISSWVTLEPGVREPVPRPPRLLPA